MSTPAGWYPDPTGKPMQRYFDGAAWTEHYAPASPPVAGVLKVGGENHVAHGVATLLTCGLALPIWLLVGAMNPKRPAAIDIYGNVIQGPRPESVPPGPPAWLRKFPWLEKLPVAGPNSVRKAREASPGFAVFVIEGVVCRCNAVGLGIWMFVRDNIDGGEGVRSQTTRARGDAPTGKGKVQQTLEGRAEHIRRGRFGHHLPQAKRRFTPEGLSD